MKNETVGVIEVTIASILFGFIPILVRWGNDIGPYTLSVARVAVAALALYLFVLLTRQRVAPFKAEKGKLLFFGAIHGFIILGYFLAIQHISIASAVLLLYSSSIWIVIFAHFILKEHISKQAWLALGVAFSGVILVLSPEQFFIKESLIGSIAGLLAGVGFGLVYVLSKTFQTYDRTSLTFWQNLIALPFVLPLLLIDPLHFTQSDILLVLALGVLCTAIPFVLVYKGFQRISAQTGGVVILLDIIFPILLAFLIFREAPTFTALLGGLLIICGFYLATRQQITNETI